jgi:hypothetical protein
VKREGVGVTAGDRAMRACRRSPSDVVKALPSLFKCRSRLKLSDADVLVGLGAESLEEEDRKADQRDGKANPSENQVGSTCRRGGRVQIPVNEERSDANPNDTQKQE